mgnify:CR=1 FL=1
MEIKIITVGKIKEKYLNDGIAEYAKRLSRYCKLEDHRSSKMKRHRIKHLMH